MKISRPRITRNAHKVNINAEVKQIQLRNHIKWLRHCKREASINSLTLNK